jgi:hypothetical protein
MPISLERLRGLEARYNGPIPSEELRALGAAVLSEEMARALSMREHHHTHAAAAMRSLRRGQNSAADDLHFHRRQFRRWNRRVWDLRNQSASLSPRTSVSRSFTG